MRKAFSRGRRFESEAKFATLLKSLLVCEREMIECIVRLSRIKRWSSSGRADRSDLSALLLDVDIEKTSFALYCSGVE
jgi:hypothetical protein